MPEKTNICTIQTTKQTRNLVKKMARHEGRTIYGLIETMTKERLRDKYNGDVMSTPSESRKPSSDRLIRDLSA